MKPKKSYSKSPMKTTNPYKRSPNKSFLTTYQASPTKSSESFISFTENPRNNRFFDVKQHLLPETTETDIEKYKELFDLLDTFNSKSLTPFDFHRAFLAQDYRIPKRFIYQIISDFDVDERGVINFDDFVKMMVTTPCKHDSEREIRKVFEQIDRDGKEFITREDIKQMLGFLNKEAFKEMQEETLDEQQIDEIIRKIGGDNQGKITWKAFLKFNREIYKKFG